ncbi:MAG: octanoyltransferase [SAR86 cluster bacterium]|uniref:Octanoyltransferase n=1 Tax=SAR86 cluster bacterium TaxID=2030880 RepID=A0A2A5B8L7_9GAMM|nr:MAG: octanoyltransferase [SAR86 cluster bacterium]
MKVRRLGLQDYVPIWKSMRYLVENGGDQRDDEIWLLSHKPVFTQGQAGKPEHVLNPGDIPLVQIDRGGQVTYHGPGQLVVYLVLNVKRRKFGVRNLVDIIEMSLIETLEEFGITASTRPKAPGVYVNDAKIAALGLRIKNGWSYHGLSLNVDMNLEPFSRINPCGFESLAITQIADEQNDSERLMQKVSKVVSNKLLLKLGYSVES